MKMPYGNLPVCKLYKKKKIKEKKKIEKRKEMRGGNVGGNIIPNKA